jgi:uncharacterized RDD family membrane protein YckC
MNTYKKITGERIIAALIDYAAIYIVTQIISIIPMFFIGIDSTIDMLFSGAFGGVGGDAASEANLIIYMMITTYGGVLVSILYFGIIPWKWNGQTLGKKLFKLKAVNEYGENPKLFTHLLRAIQNWATYFVGLLGWVLFINIIVYSIVVMIGSVLFFIILLISFIMLLAREDGRGLHDLMTGTYVISANENLDRDFAEKTAQMGDWIEVEDKDDQWGKKDESQDDWDKKKDEDDDEWEF